MLRKTTMNDALYDALRSRLKRAGSQKALAKELAISPQHMSDVINGRREPGPRVLKLLKVVKIVYYSTSECAGRGGNDLSAVRDGGCARA